MLHVLRGSNVKAKNLKKQKFTEEEAMCAEAYFRIARKDAKAGKNFLLGVKSTLESLKTDGKGHALFRAVDGQMAKLVEAGRVAAERGERVLRYSLGKANLKSTVTDLVAGRVTLRQPGGITVKLSQVNRALATMMTNRSATQDELDTVRDHVYSTGRTGDPVVSPPSNPPVKESPDVKPADLPEDDDIETGPSDMAWFPEWKDTGTGVLVIPDRYSNEVHAVTVYDPEGHAIADLDGRFMGRDGRRHFRLDRPGKTLGSGLTFVLRFIDGTCIEKHVNDGGGFQRWAYSF